MIKLNRFARFDYLHLAEYLHNESLKGNHITYASNTLLLFKQNTPQDIYYSIVPIIMKTDDKINAKTVLTTPSLTIYKTAEPLIINLQKRKIWGANLFLFIITLISFLLVLFTRNNDEFYLVNNAYLLGCVSFPYFMFVVFPYQCYEYKRYKNYENTEPIYKSTYDWVTQFVNGIIITTMFVVVCGFSLYALMGIILIILACLFPSKNRFLYGMFFSVGIYILTFSTINHNEVKDSIIPNTPSGYKSYRQNQTLFVPLKENYTTYNKEESQYISFTYYKVLNQWVKDELMAYIDTFDYKFTKDLEVEGFDACRSGEHGRYYFEKDNQILIVFWDENWEGSLEFAREKLGLGGD